jgi:hypothetical protein
VAAPKEFPAVVRSALFTTKILELQVQVFFKKESTVDPEGQSVEIGAFAALP